MGFTIEQGCPQCGAFLELEETDRLLNCPYCNVKSYLFSPDYFRYILPDKAQGRELIYAPYLRFKGVVYFCTGMTLDHRIIDITRIGLELKGIPESLGVRPQAMKMRFLTQKTTGSFLKFSLKATDILSRAAELSSRASGGILHRAFIGETMSIIYLPMYLDKNRLFDAVLNRPIATLPAGEGGLAPLMAKNQGWGPGFVSTLCPRCGGAMDGERDSVVLLCNNCHSAWEIRDSVFKGLDLSIGKGRGPKAVYIPFWRITAGVKGVDIETFSDFIRITNQPFLVDEARGDRAMNFFSPAFKIRPNIFLNLARQFTILQRDFPEEETLTGKDLHPVTLPKTEAIQALKVILASSAVNKKNVFPVMPFIDFEIKGATLVYIPFTPGLNELVHEETGMIINRQGLEFGRRM
jgi:hypothetical protein